MEKNIKSLGAAIVLQAVRDFIVASDEEKKVIIKDLRSGWNYALTDGTSEYVADILEKHPEKINVQCTLGWRG